MGMMSNTGRTMKCKTEKWSGKSEDVLESDNKRILGKLGTA